MIVATFITSRTRAAAGMPSWMSNARIAVKTASSWQIQPSIWKKIAPAAGHGRCMTARPSRAIAITRLTEPMPSSRVRPAERALNRAKMKSAAPIETTATRLEYAQAGILAVART